jgi:hypothetical protein
MWPEPQPKSHTAGAGTLRAKRRNRSRERFVIEFAGIAFSIGVGDEVIAFDEFGTVLHGPVPLSFFTHGAFLLPLTRSLNPYYIEGAGDLQLGTWIADCF